MGTTKTTKDAGSHEKNACENRQNPRCGETGALNLMKLAAVTNEVAPFTEVGSLQGIFRAAVDHGITTFEARTVEGRRFPFVSGSAWDALKTAKDTFGITFSAVSPGLFIGISVDCELAGLHKSHLLSASMDMADRLDTGTLITFAPQRGSEPEAEEFEKVADILSELVAVASRRGFDVQLENLPGTWADTSSACVALLEAVNHAKFGYVWDTGNLYEAERESHEAGFERLKPYIRNVHLKDGGFIDGKMVWKHYGTGETDIKGQIEALKAMGYSGTIVMEAACIPHQAGDFEASFGYLKTIL